jgi:hypothetical protein
VAFGAEGLQQAWQDREPKSTEMPVSADWAAALIQLAQEVLALYGREAWFLDCAYLQAEVTREQALLAMLEEAAQMMDELITPIPIDLGNVEVVEPPPDTSNRR